MRQITKDPLLTGKRKEFLMIVRDNIKCFYPPKKSECHICLIPKSEDEPLELHHVYPLATLTDDYLREIKRTIKSYNFRSEVRAFAKQFYFSRKKQVDMAITLCEHCHHILSTKFGKKPLMRQVPLMIIYIYKQRQSNLGLPIDVDTAHQIRAMESKFAA